MDKEKSIQEHHPTTCSDDRSNSAHSMYEPTASIHTAQSTSIEIACDLDATAVSELVAQNRELRLAASHMKQILAMDAEDIRVLKQENCQLSDDVETLEEKVHCMRVLQTRVGRSCSPASSSTSLCSSQQASLAARQQQQLTQRLSSESDEEDEENQETMFHHFHGLQQALMRMEHDLSNANEEAATCKSELIIQNRELRFAASNIIHILKQENCQLTQDVETLEEKMHCMRMIQAGEGLIACAQCSTYREGLMLMEHDLSNAKEEANTWKAVSEHCLQCEHHLRDLMRMEHDLANAREDAQTWKAIGKEYLVDEAARQNAAADTTSSCSQEELLPSDLQQSSVTIIATLKAELRAKDSKIKELEDELRSTKAAISSSPATSESRSCASLGAFTGDLESLYPTAQQQNPFAAASGGSPTSDATFYNHDQEFTTSAADPTSSEYETLLGQYHRDLALAEHEISSLLAENSILRAAERFNSEPPC